MSNSTPDQHPSPPSPMPASPPPSSQDSSQGNNDPTPPTPLRCFTGAMISGGLASAMYWLTRSIMETFASKPLPTGNYLATNIAVAVRTLVMGMSALVTGIFGIAALGLVALGIQLLIQRGRQPSP